MKSRHKRHHRRAGVPTPLAPPPLQSRSRKQARATTTKFHKYTRERDAALRRGESTEPWDERLRQMGGRREYQRASQISTSFHSTSKWVLGCLARNGWLHGIRTTCTPQEPTSVKTVGDKDDNSKKQSKERGQRRPCRLLEVGAINTELLDAAHAEATAPNNAGKDQTTTSESVSATTMKKTKYKLSVRAIDLHSMHEGIEEVDFLQMAVPAERYDVIVCSMVLNCVTTAADRGEMLARLFHFLRPGGLVFLTIPKTCLNLSPYIDRARFEQMLEHVGLEVQEHAKDSPKVAFFVCQRPETAQQSPTAVDGKWKTAHIIRRGQKYRNDFSITLSDKNVDGSNLRQEDDG